MAKADVVSRSGRKIKLNDGKEYTILYTVESFIQIEEDYGSVDEGMKALEGDKIKPMADFIYYGLVSKHPEITKAEVRRLISIDILPEVSEVMNQALSANNTESTEEIEDQKKSVPN